MKKRGSILIWTMFLSLFIVSFFVALQSNFLNFLNNSEKTGESLQNNIIINSTILSLKNNPVDEVSTGGVVIKSLEYDSYCYSGTLNYNEATEYLITSTGGVDFLNLQVEVGGPLEYNVISYDDSSDDGIYDSGVIVEGDSVNLNLDKVKRFNIIAVRSLGGFCDFFLQKSSTDLMPSESNYSVSKDYGEWQSRIRTEKVINFNKKTLPIDYNNYSIFINSSNYE